MRLRPPPGSVSGLERVVEGARGVSPDEHASGRGCRCTTEIVASGHELLARRNRGRVLRSRDRPGHGWPALDRIRAITSSVYEHLVDVTGARVIVDASKRLEDAAVLAGLPLVDHHVLHIVRDPRAVVFSWSRLKSSPDRVKYPR